MREKERFQFGTREGGKAKFDNDEADVVGKSVT